MKLWHLFHNRRKEVRHEAFKPTYEQRECPTSDSLNARLVSEAKLDAAMAAASALLAAHEAQARPTARVFLIRSPRVRLYDLALYFKARGYRLKQDGRGYIEAIR